MGVLKKWLALPRWQQIIWALVLGIGTGLIGGDRAAYLQPLGTLFIHAIQMLVVPVVSTAIVCAILSLSDLARMKRFIGKALLIYAISMAVSASIGIVAANVLQVGKGLTIVNPQGSVDAHILTLSEVLVNLVPTSAFQAFVNNNVLQILCFSILFGIALKRVGEEAQMVQDFFFSLSKVVFKLAGIVVGFAPYGIFALIASVFGHYGLAALLPLMTFVATVYLGCGVLMVVGYGGVLLCYGINPAKFLLKIIDPLIMAYTTSSSAATLPITMRCARENLAIRQSVADFLLPLGASFNLNGLSIYLSVAAIFSAHIFGIHLGGYQYLTLVFTIVLTAAGAAAIPGSALIVMSAVFASVGIPLAALPLIAGVDRFNDMAQTMTNVAGDLFATTIVARSELDV